MKGNLDIFYTFKAAVQRKLTIWLKSSLKKVVEKLKRMKIENQRGPSENIPISCPAPKIQNTKSQVLLSYEIGGYLNLVSVVNEKYLIQVQICLF